VLHPSFTRVFFFTSSRTRSPWHWEDLNALAGADRLWRKYQANLLTGLRVTLSCIVLLGVMLFLTDHNKVTVSHIYVNADIYDTKLLRNAVFISRHGVTPQKTWIDPKYIWNLEFSWNRNNAIGVNIVCYGHLEDGWQYHWLRSKGKSKVHPCTGTEALYGPYGPYGE
jgi:hypothetical protein